MLKAPKFWYLNKDTFYSRALYPLSLLFRLGTKIRNILSIKGKSSLPIICIGNIVIGGAGKTPVALKIGKILIQSGYKPHFISKGYAGIIKASKFTGLSKIDQHKLVYKSLKGKMGNELHALSITTEGK